VGAVGNAKRFPSHRGSVQRPHRPAQITSRETTGEPCEWTEAFSGAESHLGEFSGSGEGDSTLPIPVREVGRDENEFQYPSSSSSAVRS
jgi:hypothetical protein